MNPQVENWLKARQNARTDLYYLCREILRYRDIERLPHQEIIDHLQHFEGGTDLLNDKGQLQSYTPKVECWQLRGPRSRLILFPRGHLKTTIITIAHAIQWIINYPDIRILLSMAIGDQTKNVVTEIKAHFQFNEYFRAVFPDYCPIARKAGDWGNQGGFTVPNRKRKWLKEPTLETCTVGKTIAGMHYEVEKHSDLVDKENVRTPEQIRTVIDHFRYMSPLLERSPVPPHRGWVDVEGTRYDFSDLYGSIIDTHNQTPEDKQEWHILKKGCWREDESPLWPTRWTKDALESEERSMGTSLFSCQYLNEPVNSEDGLCKEDAIMWVPASAQEVIKPRLRLHCTIDLHGMENNADNDFTVLNVAGFDRDGRLYVVKVYRGRYTPFQIIELMFSVYREFPKLIDFKIEKDAHARVLLPFLRREMEKRGKWLPVVPIKRDNQQSKQARIRALQPWFEQQVVRFFDDLPPQTKSQLILEIVRFPKYSHDDIVDTLADHMQGRDSVGVTSDLIPQGPEAKIPGIMRVVPRFQGFGTDGREMWGSDQEPVSNCYDAKTGL